MFETEQRYPTLPSSFKMDFQVIAKIKENLSKWGIMGVIPDLIKQLTSHQS
jgi:hypothetical protein